MNRPKLFAIVGALLLAAVAHAQDTKVTLPAGTRLRVKLETPVDTKTAHAGDAVEAALIQQVVVHGRSVLPVGTYISGSVQAIRPGSHKDKVFAFLRLVF